MGHRIRHYHKPRSQNAGTPATQGASGTPTLVVTTMPPTTAQSGVAWSANPVIQLQDGLGNNVAQSGVTITMSVGSGPTGSTLTYAPSPLTTDATGKATITSATLTGTVGSYQIAFSAIGYSSFTAPSTSLSAGAPSPAKFTASVPTSATQNTTVTITIQARDSAGNACTSATNTVVVNVNGAQTTAASVTNNNNGTYSATYVATNVGTDTITITADGTAITGSPFTLTVSAPSSTLYPNKPSTLPTLYEWSCAGLWADTTGVKQTSGNGIVSGTFWRFGSTAFATTDSTAPQSPSGVCAYQWLTNLQDGNSDGIWFQAWNTASLTPVSTYYESVRIKATGPTLELPASGGMKFFGFWAVDGSGTANNQFTGWLNGSGKVTSAPLWIKQQSPVIRNMTPNLTAGTFTVGAWHQVEFLFTLNTIGVANGTCDVWIDGTHIMRYTDVTWRTATNPTGFYLRKWDPTWGGNATDTKSQTDTAYLDHIYAAGA